MVMNLLCYVVEDVLLEGLLSFPEASLWVTDTFMKLQPNLCVFYWLSKFSSSVLHNAILHPRICSSHCASSNVGNRIYQVPMVCSGCRLELCGKWSYPIIQMGKEAA